MKKERSEKWAVGFMVGCVVGFFLVTIIGKLICQLQGDTCPAPAWIKVATFIFIICVGIACGETNARKK